MKSPVIGVGVTVEDHKATLDQLPEALDQMEQLDVDYVELPLYMMDVVVGGRIVKSQLRRLKEICANRAFGYTLHGPVHSNFMDRDHIEIHRAACRASLDVSAEVGAVHMVSHSGMATVTCQDHRTSLLDFEAEQIAQAGDEAADRDVTLCIETVFAATPNIWCQTSAGLAKQLQRVNHPSVRATIDFSHAAIRIDQVGGDLMSELQEIAPLTQHLHLHDSFGTNRSFLTYNSFDQRMFGIGDVHLPMGWGSLDWDAFASLPFETGTIANLETPDLAPGAQIASVAAARSFQEAANKAYSK